MNTSERIKNIYKLLYEKYGPQGWWPGNSHLECILGAILTQNTSWSNAEKAIINLKKMNLISAEKLKMLTTDELAELIRPSGYYNQKAIKIKTFLEFLEREYDDNVSRMFEEDLYTLREKLLGIKGIGPETADCILLYAGDKAIFVVDAYTHRVLSRHGLVPEQTTYNEMQETVMDSFEPKPLTFNEFHALIVKLGKDRCKRNNPRCTGCPLESDPHTV